MPARNLDRFRIDPGERFVLKDHDAAWAGGVFADLAADAIKPRTKGYLDERLKELDAAQEVLWAANSHSVLVIVQAMDAAGKDGVIKHVTRGLNPQGCEVHSFKQPSAEELDHSFLWRAMKVLPPKGTITIFNRSYYEDVLVVKVHPEWLEKSNLPPRPKGAAFWKTRYDDINALEKHLANNGTLVLKFFLNVSKDEQKRRFLDRLEEPDKFWKFSEGDVAERAHWNEYMAACEAAINATSTPHAPWYVVPADHKWITRCVVAEVLASQIRGLRLKYPTVSKEQQTSLAGAKARLMSE